MAEEAAAEISYVKGDATAPIGTGNRIIVHVCNDVGGWGAGFVVAISRRWSRPEAAYRKWYRDGTNFGLGQVQFVRVEEDVWVANLIGQRDIVYRRKEGDPPPIRYDAIQAGLALVAQEAVNLNATVHMPRIGCGLAGGKWTEMEPVIQQSLVAFGVSVTVYDFEPANNKRNYKRKSNTQQSKGGGGGNGGGNARKRPSDESSNNDRRSGSSGGRQSSLTDYYHRW